MLNYIREINAFYVWLEENSLTPAAINLWHTLMHIHNKAGWRKNIGIARSVIHKKSGLGKTAYYRARDLLKEKGLIEYEEQGTRSTIFKLNPFCEDVCKNVELSQNRTKPKQDLSQKKPRTNSNLSHNKTNRGYSLSHNKTDLKLITSKQKHDDETDEFFKMHFGKLTPFLTQELDYWKKELGEELVLEAMQRAAGYQKGWTYAKGILKNWLKQQVTSLNEVREYDQIFHGKKDNTKLQSLTAEEFIF